MTRAIYNTATSLDGFLADAENSLSWLFAVPPEGTDEALAAFTANIGVYVEGSTTYEWLLAETRMLDHPEKWSEFYGDRPTFVFTSRDLPRPAGADVRFVHGAVATHLKQIRAAAGERDVWVVGGGDLAGQFADAGALDEIRLSVAPASLGAGAPVLPRRLGADRLALVSAQRTGAFAELVFAVTS